MMLLDRYFKGSIGDKWSKLTAVGYELGSIFSPSVTTFCYGLLEF